MKNILVGFFVFTFVYICQSQSLSGSELLDKAIEYHDPSGQWNTFNGTFSVTMETPKNSPRESKIVVNLPAETFHLKASRDTVTTEYKIQKKACSFSINGNNTPSKEEVKKHNLTCERAEMMKNYYTYLYGLPMKLKDPGTHIDSKVSTSVFKGKKYLVLKASYDESVGSDVWFFYFDPTTYAMEVYQFFKGDPNGKGKNTGEYILLSEEVQINSIKMPKIRAWYYNKNDEYLGTDILNPSTN